jgi:cell shape-determining protein MreC
MTYLVRSNEPKNGLKKPFLRLCAFVVILLILHIFAPRLLPSIFYSFISPLWQYGSDASPLVGESRETLMNQVKELTERIAEWESASTSLSMLMAENEELKMVLNRSTTTDYDRGMLAAVLKKPPYSVYDSIIIDLGENDGISKGSFVIAPGDIVIGAVSTVNKDTSIVNLFSSPGGEFDVSFGTSTAVVRANGRGGGSYEASVPRDFQVKPGDVVSIKTGNITIAGSVDDVISDPADPFAMVLFSIPVNIYELRWVFVTPSL